MASHHYIVNMTGVKRNLDFQFQVERFGHSGNNPPNKHLSSTYQDKLEICLRLSSDGLGEHAHQIINGREYTNLDYPHVVVKPPNGKYTMYNFGSRDVFFIVYPSSLMPLFEKMGLLEEPLCWNIRLTREFETLLGLISTYANASLSPGNADRIDMLCFQLFSELLLMKKNLCETLDQEQELMLRIDSWLRLHAFEKIDFNAVARKFGLSRSSLFRYWKRYSPVSPADYLLEIRLQEAAIRLKSTRDRITSIAESLQLGTPAYMVMLFKKRYGMTPLKYRKLYAQEHTTETTN